jgi:hypothetical protein
MSNKRSSHGLNTEETRLASVFHPRFIRGCCPAFVCFAHFEVSRPPLIVVWIVQALAKRIKNSQSAIKANSKRFQSGNKAVVG